MQQNFWVSFLTKCLPYLLRTIWFLQINQDLDLGTLLLTNYLILPTKFMNRLMRGFLNISKVFDTFDKVWHEGLLLKLNQNGISGNLLKLLCDFLSCQKQWVVLNGQHSSWVNVTAGVPQSSILGPLLFLIYINDLSNELSSNCKLFGDDKSRFSIVNNIHASAVTNWAFQWKIFLILI